MPKKFIYKNVVEWQEQKKGQMKAEDRESFMVATPAEFQGHPGIWTPEDLFVAAVNSCIMTTFLYLAEKEAIELVSYQSEAEGVLEIVDKWLLFSGIKVQPKIVTKTEAQAAQAKEIVHQAEKKCLISKSIKSKVIVIPDIKSTP